MRDGGTTRASGRRPEDAPRFGDQIGDGREIARMRAAVHEAEQAAGVDNGRTRELRGVGEYRRIPILSEPGDLVFSTSSHERLVRLQRREVEVAEAHGAIRSHVRIADAARVRVEASAERVGLLLRSDRHERDRERFWSVPGGELAQLRERLGEEPSTDVAEPHDERRKRDAEPGHLGGRRIAGRNVRRVHADRFRGSGPTSSRRLATPFVSA